MTKWLSKVPNSPGGNGIQLEIVSPMANLFLIAAEPRMPEVQLKAQLGDWIPNAIPGALPVFQPWTDEANCRSQFNWDILLQFSGSHLCPNSSAKHGLVHLEPSRVLSATIGGGYTPSFVLIRGGDLVITVSATVRDRKVTVTSAGLLIGGTNPTVAELSTAIPNDVLKRIASHESFLRQFLGQPGQASACPNFSADNLGGAGLFQITNPSPTADQIWNWQENLKAAVAIYTAKRKAAQLYETGCGKHPELVRLMNAYNATREKAGKKPLVIELSPLSAEQVDDDTIRGFNGWGGTDSLGQKHHLHEFEIPVDAGSLVVSDVDELNLKGVVKWRRTSTSKRFGADGSAIGDPYYVENVKKQPLF